MLVARNGDKDELIVKYMSSSDAIKDSMYERLGELTMGKEAYRDKRAEVIEEIKKEGDEATQEVLEALNAVKSKVAEAEEEEALEAA
jgi:seryl-tRNA synthetase